jgi:murein DD-endopeptidase MepM/ murein hydrolase activator NlpD
MLKKTKLIVLTLVFSLVIGINSLSINAQQNPKSSTPNKLEKPSLDLKTNNPKKKIKISNGVVDTEPEIKLDQKEQERFDKCKKEVASKRAKRFKNKPTPCLKLQASDIPSDGHINVEDYNVLWATVAENKDILDNKVNPDIELPLSSFVDLDKVEIQADTNRSSVSSSSTSSVISSSSSVTSSLASSLSSSQISTSSSQNSTISSTSNSSTISSVRSNPVITSSSNSSVDSSKKTSFWENLIFGVRAKAAINDGFRLPYENGVRTKLNQTAFNNDVGGDWGANTHASHWDYAAFDFYGEGSNYKITAAKAGTVVYSADNGGAGFGNHIVISHPDGSYALYAHLNLRKVAVGNTVTRGQYIGNEGTSGGQTSQHLHFETFNRYPCAINNGTYSRVENCFEYKAGAYKSVKGNSYYLASVMAPTFDECANNTSCTNGYPNVAYAWYTSQNSLENTQYVLFRDFNNGNNSIWGFANTTHTGDTSFPNYVPSEWKVAGMGDFNGDGHSDIYWRNSKTGQNVIWEMKNGVVTQDWGVISAVGLEFSVAGIGDFNGDGYADVLWRNTSGQNVIWNYNRNQKIGDSGVFSTVPSEWKVVSVADFNNDGKADIFWRNSKTGQNVIWNMNNASIIQNGSDGLSSVGLEFYVAGLGDFDGDRKKDIFWRNTNGQNVIWNMNNRSIVTSNSVSSVGNDFIVAGLGDFNVDGKADIFWRNQNGQQNVIWNMNNAAILTNTPVGSTGASNTQVKGIFAK